MPDKIYDTVIIGGGLAGLSLSILLSQQGFSVLLIEKEEYPFHKVCGEYISMESFDFIERLGLPLRSMNLPMISKLVVTSPGGTKLEHNLDPGGFGISRYTIDHKLKEIAQQLGVDVMENCKAEEVIFKDEYFIVKTNKGNFSGRVCCGSYGKRSNLDVKWKRTFTKTAAGKLNNFVGIKYHINFHMPDDTIALHNFSDGYCGISKIEDGRYCLCYLTTAENLKKSGNSIEQMEKTILSENVFLKDIFSNSTKLFSAPVTISQISFSKKTQVEDHVLLLGDAAGMITPLCGNGMSMAMHGAKIAAENITSFLKKNITRNELEEKYTNEWKRNFEKRLKTGRMIQRFFGKKWLTNLFVNVMKRNPWLTKMIIKRTHGERF